MAENWESRPLISVQYDEQADILTFSFTEVPQPAVAEETADEVWVRYDPKTRRVMTVDVLNFSARGRAAFGPTLTYTERTDRQRLEFLHGLPLPTDDGAAWYTSAQVFDPSQPPLAKGRSRFSPLARGSKRG